MPHVHLKGWLNTFLALAIRFFILLLIYALLRLGFYYYNASFFPQVDGAKLALMMWGGVKFDIVALLYLNIVYMLMEVMPFPFKYQNSYRRVAQWVFVLCNSLGIALNLMDYVYYPYTLKRTTGTVFSQFAHESNKAKLAFDFVLDYWYMLLVLIALIGVLLRLYRLFIVDKPKSLGWGFYTSSSVAFLGVIFLFIGGVRGGWAHSTRPITLSNAGDYVELPEEMNIVLNTPFSMLKTIKAVQLKEQHYFDAVALQKRYPVIHHPDTSRTFDKKNVVFLILESFGKEFVGALNKDLPADSYRGYTPFLDSLIAHSYTFNRSFANGRKSIDALPAIITGIPAVGEPFVLSIYSSNKTTSIAKLLGDEGYQTAFFHGAPNGSMGFSAYTQLAGIARYYGKNEYGNDQDFDGIWGIWDEPFMQYMADEIDQMKEPFFASFFSLSSHHPFKVPEKYSGVFPKGALPIHEPIGYSDHALKQFFAKAERAPWFKNTIFVLVADHATVSAVPQYQTAANAFAIPIIFYAPGMNLQGQSDKLIQQIDIMPTVLNLIGYQKPYFSFGFDAFQPDKQNFVVNNIGGTYNFYQDHFYMRHDGSTPVALYDLKNDALLKDDLLLKNTLMRDSLDQSLKAFIQQYNYHMIHNRLTAQ